MLAYFSSLSPAAFTNALPGNIAQGLIWGIMALGVYITFRLLDFADLTVDGSCSYRNDDGKRMQYLGIPALCLYRRTSGRTLHRTVTYQARNSTYFGGNPDTDCIVFHQPEHHAASCKSGT